MLTSLLCSRPQKSFSSDLILLQLIFLSPFMVKTGSRKRKRRKIKGAHWKVFFLIFARHLPTASPICTSSVLTNSPLPTESISANIVPILTLTTSSLLYPSNLCFKRWVSVLFTFQPSPLMEPSSASLVIDRSSFCILLRRLSLLVISYPPTHQRPPVSTSTSINYLRISKISWIIFHRQCQTSSHSHDRLKIGLLSWASTRNACRRSTQMTKSEKSLPPKTEPPHLPSSTSNAHTRGRRIFFLYIYQYM